ncbi:hypothetical protein A2U01_0036101, partial [Trifolium medium]|nr:hypothetical protein [Trifolium medium]
CGVLKFCDSTKSKFHLSSYVALTFLIKVLHSFHHMISDSATLTPMLFAADDSVIALADRCPHLRLFVTHLLHFTHAQEDIHS